MFSILAFFLCEIFTMFQKCKVYNYERICTTCPLYLRKNTRANIKTTYLFHSKNVFFKKTSKILSLSNHPQPTDSYL